MFHIIRELPEHIELSEHLREKAPFYLRVQSFGISYYIAATPKIRLWLELDAKGQHKPRDRRHRWDNYEKGDALREVIQALELQVRDVVMAGIEQNVTQTLLNRMREVMHPTVRGMIDAEVQKALPQPGNERD